MAVVERVRRALAEGTRFGDIRHFDTIDSTNRWVRQQADAGAPEGLVAVADHQSAGRGRLGRSWEAPPGAGLLVSVLLRPTALPMVRYHLVTAAVALSARAACAVEGFTCEVKWPNDLLVADRKLAGVLAESSASAVVVGIGLNLSAAPEGAVTAREAAGRAIGRDELLLGLLEGLEARLQAGWDAVTVEYRHACATVGRRVRVEMADRTVEGTAVAVDDDGRLVVAPDGGGAPVAVSAGDVVHLRPPAG